MLLARNCFFSPNCTAREEQKKRGSENLHAKTALVKKINFGKNRTSNLVDEVSNRLLSLPSIPRTSNLRSGSRNRQSIKVRAERRPAAVSLRWFSPA